MPLYCGEYLPKHPQFSAGSEARCSADAEPVPMDAAPLQYTAEDDEAIDEYSRSAVQTSWHSVCSMLFASTITDLIATQLGTCAMKPREQGGVVDAQLNVYGVTGLKVAGMRHCISAIS